MRSLGPHEHPVAKAIRQQGCPACRLIRDSERRYWNQLLYEGFQDAAAIRELRESIGYCIRHEWQLAQRRDLFASAVLVAASVGGARRQLETPRRRWRSRSLRRVGAACPVCAAAATTEAHTIGTLCRLVCEFADWRETYRRADGLCFDHLGLAAAVAGPEWEQLRGRAAIRLEALAVELTRLRKSFDYREPPPELELARAWQRAVTALRGDPGRVV